MAVRQVACEENQLAGIRACLWRRRVLHFELGAPLLPTGHGGLDESGTNEESMCERVARAPEGAVVGIGEYPSEPGLTFLRELAAVRLLYLMEDGCTLAPKS